MRPLIGCYRLVKREISNLKERNLQQMTGRVAETFFAGGWKIKTLLANLVCSMRREINENLFAEGAR